MQIEIDIAAKLKSWRERHGLSQSQAAVRLGVSVRTLQNWEISRRRPRGIALRALMEALSE